MRANVWEKNGLPQNDLRNKMYSVNKLATTTTIMSKKATAEKRIGRTPQLKSQHEMAELSELKRGNGQTKIVTGR